MTKGGEPTTIIRLTDAQEFLVYAFDKTSTRHLIWYEKGFIMEPETEDTNLSAGFFIADRGPSTIKDRTNTSSDERWTPVELSAVLLESFEVEA